MFSISKGSISEVNFIENILTNETTVKRVIFLLIHCLFKEGGLAKYPFSFLVEEIYSSTLWHNKWHL